MNFNVSGRRRSRPDGGDCSGCCGGTGEVPVISVWAVGVPVQLQTHASHIQRHSSEAARTFSRTFNDASYCGTCRDHHVLFGGERGIIHSPELTGYSGQSHDTLPIRCDNPTIHCRYSATIPRFTADTLQQSHDSLPIICHNPTIHCRYSVTIPRYKADPLRKSHDSLPIFHDNPMIYCRYSATVPWFTADNPRQSHDLLPIFRDNATTHCRYSATIPRFVADILWQSFSERSGFIYEFNFKFPATKSEL